MSHRPDELKTLSDEKLRDLYRDPDTPTSDANQLLAEIERRMDLRQRAKHPSDCICEDCVYQPN
jgi:hypothetical protein